MEVKDIVISIVVPLVVAVMSYFGSRRGTKVSREEFENRKEATPPELLRLEKWSTILKDSEEYPQGIKGGLDLGAIYSTYNDVLMRATLENEIMKLGVLSSDVRHELLQVRPGSGGKYYPSPSWRVSRRRDLFVLMGGIVISVCVFILSFNNISNHDWVSTIACIFGMMFSIIFTIIFCFGIYNYVGKNTVPDYIRDITFRNSYRALKNIYLAPGVDDVFENPDQVSQRKKFEEHRGYNSSYVTWRRDIKEKHPEWTSWNYGLSISGDNNPCKNNTNGLEPNHLPSSLFRAESPKRREL